MEARRIVPGLLFIATWSSHFAHGCSAR